MPSKNEILELEKKFFQTMVDKDGDTATAMCGKDVLVSGSQRAVPVKGADMGKMMAEGKWDLRSFEISDFNVVFPTDELAVSGYKADMDMVMDGKPMKMSTFDSSTWMKDGDSWICIQHSETPMESGKSA